MTRRTLETISVIAGSLLFGVAFSYPVLRNIHGVGAFHDWDLHGRFQWVDFFSVQHFHQFPFWNPYKCGGIPMFANPHSEVLNPFFLLHLLFNPFVGERLEIPLHLAIGWSGGYVLARILRVSEIAAVVCGSVYAGSSWFSLHISVGHTDFLPMLYLPWIIAFIWQSVEGRVMFPAAIAGFLIALSMGEGGVYSITLAVLVAGLLTTTLAPLKRSFWPIVIFISFAAFALGFAAVKLIPTFELLRAHPRPWDHREAASLRMMAIALFSRFQSLDQPHIWTWDFWEYGAYIGPIAAALALIGVAGETRKAMPWVIVGVILFSLAMGEGGPHYPWVLLHKLPIFSFERATPRMLIGFTLTIGVLAAFGADYLARNRVGWSVTFVSVAIMLVDFWLVSVPTLDHVVAGDLESQPPAPTFRQFGNRLAALNMVPATMSNQGSLSCYDYTDFSTTAVGVDQQGYFGEQYLLGQGFVAPTNWTPNVLYYRVSAPQPTTLIIDQNYYPSWHMVEGRGEVFSSDGLLAVRIPAGEQDIKLRYRENTFFLGLAISILTLVAAASVMFVERRRRGTVA
jgi:hypothetical protein